MELTDEQEAFYSFCKDGELDYIRLLWDNILVKKHLSLTWRDHFGKTPLHVSAEAGHTHVVRFLLDSCGIDIDTKDNMQYTALHLAVSKGHLNCSKLLLSEVNTPILNSRTSYGENLYDIATRMRHTCIINLLSEYSENSGIGDFLNKIGLSQYEEVFEREDVTLELILSGCISDSDLKELGVSTMGHRRAILSKASLS